MKPYAGLGSMGPGGMGMGQPGHDAYAYPPPSFRPAHSAVSTPAAPAPFLALA